MKRYIKAYVEPSASEYGEFVSQAHRNMNDRYYPFKVSSIYFNPHSMNSTGYRITLDEHEWIAYQKGTSFSSRSYELYGPFYPNEIQSAVELFHEKPLDNFKSLGSIISYLFEEGGVEV